MTLTRRVDPNSLMLFYEVVSAGSLARASDSIGIPKSTLSRKLRALENQLQVVLIKRGAQGIKLTEAGEAIMCHCQRIRCEVDQTEEVANELVSEPAGTLRISVPPAFGCRVVSKVMARVSNRFDRLRQEIVVTSNPVNIGDEPFDIVIQVGEVGNDNVPSRLLTIIDRGFFASPNLFKNRKRPETEHDLVNFPRVMIPSHIGQTDIWPCGLHETDDANLRAVVTDVSMARQLVVEGMGVGILPVHLCQEDVEAGRLERILPDFRLPSANAYASYLEHRHQPARLRAFMDALIEEFENVAPPRRH